MIKVAVLGASGTMGRILIETIEATEDFAYVAGVPSDPDMPGGFAELMAIDVPCDVLVDFSHHSLLESLLDFGLSRSLPLVIATTGYSEEQEQLILEASRYIPIFRAKNFSLGVNLLVKLVQEAQHLLKDFDIEIIEKHHNKKLDAPSGTAFLLADSLNGNQDHPYRHGRFGKSAKRETGEIGIHSVRGGTIVGEHSVIFAGVDEILELKHAAHSKKVFAEGALKAAGFLVKKSPGLYTMNDLIEGGSPVE